MLTMLIAISTVMVIALAASGQTPPDGSTEEQRREYISTLGYRCAEGEQARNIVIPAHFTEVYENYNQLQLQSGFDLSRYKGDSAICYTYSITNYPDPTGGFYRDIKLTLITVGGKIVGGDISSAALDGFMEGLSCRDGTTSE
ncbi:MAG: DUF4830 domain-containing protein [Eubacterium sp.]|nr:DUF4830 domain-containing protein [Eubacterium sp.]